MKSACIIGATSSLGRALGELLSRDNVPLLLASRDRDYQKDLACDLRIRHGILVNEAGFESENPAAFHELATLIHQLPAPKVIFFTPGDAVTGQTMESNEAVNRCIQTNFTCAAQFFGHFIHSAAPLELRDVSIVIVGSIAGIRGRAANPVYGAAKAALHVFTEAIGQTMHQAGGSACLVVLGYMDSQMSRGRCPPWATASPRYVAEQILKALDKGSSVAYIPKPWRYVLLVLRLIPDWIWKRMTTP